MTDLFLSKKKIHETNTLTVMLDINVKRKKLLHILKSSPVGKKST